MNWNWEQMILKAIVPISFLAIWALTALFNRESKGFPARPPGSPPGGPRPTDPTLRWGPASGGSPQVIRRVPIGDDDILIIPSDPARAARPAPARPAQATGVRRTVKGRQAPAPVKKVEPTATRPKLGGVTQSVNQSLAKPSEFTPLASATVPMTRMAPSEPPAVVTTASIDTPALTVARLRPLVKDPVRLREAFILNELLQPPVTLRRRRGHHA